LLFSKLSWNLAPKIFLKSKFWTKEKSLPNVALLVRSECQKLIPEESQFRQEQCSSQNFGRARRRIHGRAHVIVEEGKNDSLKHNEMKLMFCKSTSDSTTCTMHLHVLHGIFFYEDRQVIKGLSSVSGGVGSSVLLFLNLAQLLSLCHMKFPCFLPQGLTQDEQATQ
jgi:hypothetical protein